MAAPLDWSWFAAALRNRAEDAKRPIGEPVLRVIDQSIRDNALGGSRNLLFVGLAIEDGFRNKMREFARFTVDAEALGDPRAGPLLMETANGLGDDLIRTHWSALFGAPAFGPPNPLNNGLRAKLTEISRQVVDDLQHGLVDGAKYPPLSAPTIVNSPTYNVAGPTQFAGDHATQSVGVMRTGPQLGGDRVSQTALGSGQTATIAPSPDKRSKGLLARIFGWAVAACSALSGHPPTAS